MTWPTIIISRFCHVSVRMLLHLSINEVTFVYQNFNQIGENMFHHFHIVCFVLSIDFSYLWSIHTIVF